MGEVFHFTERRRLRAGSYTTPEMVVSDLGRQFANLGEGWKVDHEPGPFGEKPLTLTNTTGVTGMTSWDGDLRVVKNRQVELPDNLNLTVF